jgi:outer membrane protein OmpA-like peptidoglycan-associated protein
MKKHLFIILLFITALGYTQETTPGEYTVQNVDVNTKNSDFGTAFYGKGKVVFAAPKEGLTLTKTVWENNSQPFLDLFVGEINEKGEIVHKQKMPGDINSKYHEGVVSFTKDMKTVYFSANNYVKKRKQRTDSTGTNNIQIFRASVNENGEWSSPRLLPFNSTKFSTGHPALNLDDTELYFISDRPESIGETDIFVVTINEDGTYSEPRNLGPRINTEEREMFPFISDDNILYFSSDGYLGTGELDVYASKIFDNTVSEPISLGSPVNSEKDDFAYIIDDSKHEGYFSSNREGGKGDDDIYKFLVSPPLYIECNQEIIGITKDINTDQLLPGVLVQLFDEEGNELDSFLSKLTDASFRFEQPCDATYKIVGTLEGYLPEEIEIQTLNDLDLPPIEITMSLPQDEAVIAARNSARNISGIVKDNDSQEIVLGAQVQLLNDKGEVIETVVSNENDASFQFSKPFDSTYKIAVSSKGHHNEVIDLKNINPKENNAPFEVLVNSSLEDSFVADKNLSDENVISGIVKDSNSQELLPGVLVELLDENGNVLETVVSHPEDASFQFMKPYDSSYKIVDSSKGYLKEELELEALSSIDNQDKVEILMQQPTNKFLVVDEKNKININSIYFDFDKFNIRSDAEFELDKIAAIMHQNPDMTIEVNAHADSRGKDAYNITLSNNRAESTMQYLVSKGIALDRMKGKGYGERQLATKCPDGVKCTEFMHQLNRRSEFSILNSLNGITIVSNNVLNSSSANTNDAVANSGAFVNYDFSRENTTIVYTAQIGAFQGDVQTNKFDKLNNLFNHRYQDGFNRYFSGKFKTPEEARTYANTLKKRGFDGVFIVGLKGDSRL